MKKNKTKELRDKQKESVSDSKDNLKILKEIIKVLEENNLSEVTFAVGDLKVSVKKSNDGILVHNPAQSQPAELPDSTDKQEAQEPANLIPLNSPLAGVFYRSSGPDADPYVDIGDIVEKDQALCIVEAMKVFNEINSDIKGRIARIEAENAKPVEQGQVLFYLEPVE